MKVLELEHSPFTKDGQEVDCWKVKLEGQWDWVNCYSGGGVLRAGEELPEGWEIKTSKANKPYLAGPRVARNSAWSTNGGRPSSWQNTEEGQRFIQDRMDKRTALMQAVQGLPLPSIKDESAVFGLADRMYAWLQSSGPAGEGGAGQRGVEGPATGEGADNPSLLAQLSGAWGSGAKALKAARLLYKDNPPAALSELTEAQMRELIAEATRE